VVYDARMISCIDGCHNIMLKEKSMIFVYEIDDLTPYAKGHSIIVHTSKSIVPVLSIFFSSRGS
jgi:hypothetical protein